MKRNVKKLLFGVLPLFGMLVSGCSLGPKSSSSTPDPYVPPEGEPEEPEVADDTITGISLKYSVDFFMRVNDVLDFSASFTGKGDDSQKGVKWTTTSSKVVSIEVDQAKTSKCVLKAHKEGTATITGTSEYMPSLSKSVTITVVDDSEYLYMWQTQSGTNDNKLFNGNDGNTKTDGTVALGGMDWTFHFDTPTKNVGGGQSLQLGTTDNPYGNVDFSATNTKKIRKISVYCSSSAVHIDDGSAHGTSGDVGTSKLTVTVGGTTYMDEVTTPKYSTNQPLGVLSGDTVYDGSLTGNISIHFSPTYKDEEHPEINSGAIYIKAIIIEYYRGDLQSIAFDGLYLKDSEGHDTTVRNDATSQYYVNSPFERSGVSVLATFSENTDIKVNVTRFASFAAEDLDDDDYFETPGDDKTVTVTYTYEKDPSSSKTVSNSYEVNVAPAITGITFTGTFDSNKYLVYDQLDYSGIKVVVVVENLGNFKEYELADFNEQYFKDLFNVSSLPTYAIKSMQTSGFEISVAHKLAPHKTGSKTVVADEIIVKEVKKIDVYYKDGETPYDVTFVDGEVIDYSQFNAKVTYDNDEYEEYSLPDLVKQKYIDPAVTTKSNSFPRFNYNSYTPLVAEEALETEGYGVVVKSTLNDVTGTMEIPAHQVTVKSVSSLELKLDALSKTEYFENDDMDYTGITLDITLDTAEKATLNYADMVAAKTNVSVRQTDGSYKVSEVSKFEITAPKEATKDMENGFDFSVKYARSEVSDTLEIPANSITVASYIAKTYSKVKSMDDFDSAGLYIITSVDPENSRLMRIWNGALSKDNIFSTKGTNYLTYNSDTGFGDSLTIDKSAVEKAVFQIIKNDDDGVKTITVVLASTKDDTKPAKLTVNSGSPSFTSTTSSNAAKQKLSVAFEDGNIQAGYNGGTYQKFIYYNKASNSNCFSCYALSTNCVPIQIYKLNASA